MDISEAEREAESGKDNLGLDVTDVTVSHGSSAVAIEPGKYKAIRQTAWAAIFKMATEIDLVVLLYRSRNQLYLITMLHM